MRVELWVGHRRLLLVVLAILVMGGLLDTLGGWISIAAKLAWATMAGGRRYEQRLAIPVIIAFFLALISNSLLVVIKENNEAVEDWVKNVFSRLWIGHGILAIAVFVIAFLASIPFA